MSKAPPPNSLHTKIKITVVCAHTVLMSLPRIFGLEFLVAFTSPFRCRSRRSHRFEDTSFSTKKLFTIFRESITLAAHNAGVYCLTFHARAAQSQAPSFDVLRTRGSVLMDRLNTFSTQVVCIYRHAICEVNVSFSHSFTFHNLSYKNCAFFKTQFVSLTVQM